VARVTARPPINPTSMPSALSTQSSGKPDSSTIDDREQSTKPDEDPQSGLFHQVYDWLQHEKTRRQARKARRAGAVSASAEGTTSNATLEDQESEETHPCSESTFSLDKLEKILLQYAGPGKADALGALHSLKRASRRRPKGLRRGSASESDYTDVEAPVPSVEAYLDNSKTLAYLNGDAADEDITASSASLKRSKDYEAWTAFRAEIVRLAHTLQLRGWRKVPMESADEIEVVRLSGALTNAVYVVRPPKNLPPPKTENRDGPTVSRKPPP
jgi:choline kinase